MEVKMFPEDMSVFEVDCSDMKKCLLSGLYKEEVEIQGCIRVFYTYLTPDLSYNQPCLVIAPPDNERVTAFIEEGFWAEFAAKEKVFLHFLEPEGFWNLDGTDADYMNKVYIQIQSRKYYVTMQDNIYACGIARGATVAQQAAMKMTSEWSGLATFGNMEADALLNAATTHQKEDTGQTELVVSASKAQLPVWMLWTVNKGMNEEVCAYWKKQNDVEDEVFSSGGADEIYIPSAVCKKSTVNEEKISQVRVTNHYDGELSELVFHNVWKYVSKARRHRSFGTKALRNYKNPRQYGAELHTLEIDGFSRVWYEYVPARVKDTKKKVPLVINMHGRGGRAESFMDISGMSCVAEERDFIVLFPEAGIHQQTKTGIRNILLWEGLYYDKKIDDVAFILKMIEDVKSRYAIDETRIYACGQSSGGMMTSELAIQAPEIFAAVSPWSAIKSPESKLPPPTEINPPVPYLFLFGESDWLCVNRENSRLEYKVEDDIAEFLENLMDIYQLDKEPMKYQCGEISYYVYPNKKKTPMLIVGTIRDMSHANYPRESWIAYDEFFSKFSKRADGTLLYMGKEAILSTELTTLTGM